MLIVNVIVNAFVNSWPSQIFKIRSSPPEVLLVKRILTICSKFTVEHPCQSAISMKLQSSFIEITVRDGCTPVTWLHSFRTLFYKDTSGGLCLWNGTFCENSYFVQSLILDVWQGSEYISEFCQQFNDNRALIQKTFLKCIAGQM